MDQLEEYKMLRTEIMYYMNKDTTLLTCLFSCVTAILFFSLEYKVPEGCFLTYLVIIPICGKMAYHKRQMAKISAYLSVYLEETLDIKWERCVAELSKHNSRPRVGRFLKFSECFMMAVATVLCYGYLILKRDPNEWDELLIRFEAVLMAVLFLAVVYLTAKNYKTADYREMFQQNMRGMGL